MMPYNCCGMNELYLLLRGMEKDVGNLAARGDYHGRKKEREGRRRGETPALLFGRTPQTCRIIGG